MKTRVKEKIFSNKGAILTSILTALCGLVLVIWPSEIKKGICYAIATAIVIVGVVYIIQYAKKDVMRDFYRKDLTIGLIMLTLGIIAFIKWEAILNVIPVLLGILILYSGLSKLQNALDLMRLKAKSWLAIMIISILNILFGIIMIVEPAWVMDMLFVLLGIGLLFGGITDIVTMIFFQSHLKKMPNDSDIIE